MNMWNRPTNTGVGVDFVSPLIGKKMIVNSNFYLLGTLVARRGNRYGWNFQLCRYHCIKCRPAIKKRSINYHVPWIYNYCIGPRTEKPKRTLAASGHS